MPNPLADKIKNTQNSFASQPPGSVTACPFKKTVSEAPSPVEVETAFALTQQIMQTMSIGTATQKTKVKKEWIEIILVDLDGNPMPGVKYRITPPNGASVEGNLNQYGQAGLYQIDPGNCKITFPDLDKDAWD